MVNVGNEFCVLANANSKGVLAIMREPVHRRSA